MPDEDDARSNEPLSRRERTLLRHVLAESGDIGVGKSLYSKEDDDKNLIRTVYEIKKCPLHTEGCHNSWKKHHPWSLESPQKCLSLIHI